MTRARVVVGFFAVVSVLSFTAASLPVFKGGGTNVTFGGSGLVFLIVAVANAKKARADAAKPPPRNEALRSVRWVPSGTSICELSNGGRVAAIFDRSLGIVTLALAALAFGAALVLAMAKGADAHEAITSGMIVGILLVLMGAGFTLAEWLVRRKSPLRWVAQLLPLAIPVGVATFAFFLLGG